MAMAAVPADVGAGDIAYGADHDGGTFGTALPVSRYCGLSGEPIKHAGPGGVPNAPHACDGFDFGLQNPGTGGTLGAMLPKDYPHANAVGHPGNPPDNMLVLDAASHEIGGVGAAGTPRHFTHAASPDPGDHLLAFYFVPGPNRRPFFSRQVPAIAKMAAPCRI